MVDKIAVIFDRFDRANNPIVVITQRNLTYSCVVKLKLNRQLKKRFF